MKKQLTTLLILFGSLMIAQGQISTDIAYYQAFPTLEKVAQHYFTTNSIDVQKSAFINFAKKTDGWYVHELAIEDWTKISNETKIWSAKDKEFLTALASPDYISNLDEDKKIAEYMAKSILQRYNAKYFDIAPVYGYDGYETDLFTILEGKNNLPAEILNIKARAYSQICDKMMHKIPSEKYGNTFDTYFKTFNKKDIPAQGIKDYIALGQAGIQIFKEIKERFPDFYTFVGNIRIKYWNEHIAKFHDLLQLQHPDAAQQFLVDDLYDEFSLTYAKNMLNTCNQKAILFTQGDFDTYTCLYVQNKLNYRKDITVINTGLANLDYHIFYQKEIKKTPTTLSVKRYTDDIKYYSTFGLAGDTLDFYRFLKDVQTDPQPFQLSVDGLLTTPSPRLAIPNKNRVNIAEQFGGIFKFDKNLYTTFTGRTISRAQFFTLDIITTNQWKRPIYFALGTNRGSQLFLNKYLKWEGFAYRLIPKLGTDAKLENINSNLLTRYKFQKPPSYMYSIDRPNAAYIQYLSLFYISGRQATTQFKDKELKQLMKILTTHFPYHQMSYQSYAAFFADYYYKTKAYTTGNQVILKRANELIQLTNKANGNVRTLEYLTTQKDHLVSIARKSDDMSFADRIKAMLE